MKRIQLTISALTFLLCLLGPIRVVQAQGGGCSANSTSTSATQYEVIQSIPLAPAIAETSSTQIPEVFLKNSIKLAFQTGQAVILSSTPDGNGDIRSDDIVNITSNGFVFKHDFRSADRNCIEPIRPVVVTGLFTAGDNTIEIELTDLFPAYKSSSAYYLVVVPASSASLPMPAPLFKPVPPTVIPTATTVASPTSTFTSTPVATLTPTPRVVEYTPAPPLELPSFSWPFPPRYLWFGFIFLTVMALIIWLMERQARLIGVLVITKNGEPWAIVDLSTFGGMVTIGREGRIKLEDEDEDNPTLARIEAQLIAERGSDGQVQVLWKNVGENSDLDTTAYHIRHGHVEAIGAYRLAYENLSEVELTEDYLDGGIWNELSR